MYRTLQILTLVCRSCADILLFSAYKWNIARPSLVTDVSMFHFYFDHISDPF